MFETYFQLYEKSMQWKAKDVYIENHLDFWDEK